MNMFCIAVQTLCVLNVFRLQGEIGQRRR